jgi:hypothetical protein
MTVPCECPGYLLLMALSKLEGAATTRRSPMDMPQMRPPATDPFIREQGDEARRLNAPDDVWQAFRSQYNSAKRRNIEFKFTFEQWWDWWKVDNRIERRGMGRDALLMARFNDVGPYSADNVFCTTHHDNVSNMGEESRKKHGENLTKSWVGRVCHLTGKREDHPKAQAVVTPLGWFGNATLAAEAYGMTRQAAGHRARNGIGGFRYATEADADVPRADLNRKDGNIQDAPLHQTKNRPIITPKGRYFNAKAAGDAHGITGGAAAIRARRGAMGFRFADQA